MSKVASEWMEPSLCGPREVVEGSGRYGGRRLESGDSCDRPAEELSKEGGSREEERGGGRRFGRAGQELSLCLRILTAA